MEVFIIPLLIVIAFFLGWFARGLVDSIMEQAEEILEKEKEDYVQTPCGRIPEDLKDKLQR